MALRISWFKVHRPIYYYAAYFLKEQKNLMRKLLQWGKMRLETA